MEKHHVNAGQLFSTSSILNLPELRESTFNPLPMRHNCYEPRKDEKSHKEL